MLLFWVAASVLAFAAMGGSFWAYVKAEQQVEETANFRFNAMVSAEKMRHTSESLTKMVRNYLLTGNPQYKDWYEKLDAVRQGTSKEPSNPFVWDLRVYGEEPPLDVQMNSMSLQEYLNSVAAESEYGKLLHESFSSAQILSKLERQAIALFESPNPVDRKKAVDLMFSSEYNEAKLNVLRPLMTFRGVSSERNVAATEKAHRWANATRTSFLLLSWLSLLLAWRTYQAMRSIHGASVKELQAQIERLGHGDFASAEGTETLDPDSLMAWLNQSRVRLQELDSARQSAECELSDKNRVLALNNLVLQELSTGLSLPQLLDKFIQAVEKDHPGMYCSILLAHKDGHTLRHASAPSMGEEWARVTAKVSIGAGVGSCGTAACKNEAVFVEDVQIHPFWTDFQDVAREANIRSAWSQPIVDSQNIVIGTFAIYQRFPALPGEQERRWLHAFAQLAGYIIERSRIAQALNQTQYLYDLIAKNVTDLIWVQNLPNMGLRYLSPSSSKVLGWTPEEFYANPHQAFSDTVKAQLVERFMGMYNQIQAGNQDAMAMTFESELITKERGIIPVEVSVKATLNERGVPSKLIGVARDISERRKSEEIIRKMAFYDALTGLPNRRLLDDRLHQILMLAKRNQTKAAMLFIDLDRFKAVNDTHGHQVGDWLLVQVASRMTQVVRESDTAARVGGDEFVVVLPNTASIELAVTTANKIRAKLDEPFVTEEGIHLDISCSVGVVMYPDQADNGKDLMHFGDEAMYHAKKEGRNAVVIFDAQSSKPTASK